MHIGSFFAGLKSLYQRLSLCKHWNVFLSFAEWWIPVSNSLNQYGVCIEGQFEFLIEGKSIQISALTI